MPYIFLIKSGDNNKKMENIQENLKKQENKLHLLGWILFIVCALFYIASSLKNQDTLTFIGSIFFLVACIVFIIPLVKKMKK
jgi:predicted membrane channel-forming protein YqfA (hemolysin III family)